MDDNNSYVWKRGLFLSSPFIPYCRIPDEHNTTSHFFQDAVWPKGGWHLYHEFRGWCHRHKNVMHFGCIFLIQRPKEMLHPDDPPVNPRAGVCKWIADLHLLHFRGRHSKVYFGNNGILVPVYQDTSSCGQLQKQQCWIQIYTIIPPPSLGAGKSLVSHLAMRDDESNKIFRLSSQDSPKPYQVKVMIG